MKKKIRIRLNSAEREGVAITKQKKLIDGKPTGSRQTRIKHRSKRPEHLLTTEEIKMKHYEILEELLTSI